MLPIGLHELPQGLGFVVLSREEPSATLARLRLSGEMTCIDATRMQLTAEESHGVGAAVRLGDAVPDHAILCQLHARTQGWMAGLVLLLEQSRIGNAFNPSQIPAGRELLFDYFAGEVFAQFTAVEQDFLLKTALLTRISASAAHELSGNPRAATILEGLARHNYFTVRHAESYEYHPLFRQFLRARLQREHAPEKLAALRRSAAALAEASGNAEDAVQLWIDASAWQELCQYLYRMAPVLHKQGRGLLLAAWIGAVADCVTGAGSVATFLARTGTPAVRTARIRADADSSPLSDPVSIVGSSRILALSPENLHTRTLLYRPRRPAAGQRHRQGPQKTARNTPDPDCPGRSPVGVEHIIEQLWPDAEGDAAANLFKITLHRLRKLLVHEDALEVAKGLLTINPEVVWVDSWSLARALSETSSAETVSRALTLYHGHFLERESISNTAVVRYREQLRGRVLRSLKSLIKSCEQQQDWAAVVNHSGHALSLNDIDEDLHSAAIRAHLARGRPAEALSAFAHAKQCYTRLNLNPPAQLQALIQACG